jgi:hypothetical protein
MSTMPDRTRNNVRTRHPAMASKLVTGRSFRRASVLVFGDQPAPLRARRAAPVRLV